MELVTEPVIYDADTAMNFARELQLLLRTLGVGEANLEKGEMRIEANVSVTTDPERRPENYNQVAEIKNLNSFKIVGAAIDYEIKRQTALYEAGETMIKQTRGWDENKQQTFFQRAKETSDDYRYFPDPDIPKFKLSELSEFNKDTLQESLPELPWVKRERYIQWGINPKAVEYFLNNPDFDSLFAETLNGVTDVKIITKTANYITSDLAGFHGDTQIDGSIINVTPSAMTELIRMTEDGELSSRGAKDTLLYLYQNGGNTREIAEAQGLIQENNEDAMRELVVKLITDNPTQAEALKGGEEKLAAFFVGQAMKASGGAANPQIVGKLLKELL